MQTISYARCDKSSQEIWETSPAVTRLLWWEYEYKPEDARKAKLSLCKLQVRLQLLLIVQCVLSLHEADENGRIHIKIHVVYEEDLKPQKTGKQSAPWQQK